MEALTYRLVGHSRSDPGHYRKPGELDSWKLRDPLLISEAMLEDRFGVPPAELQAVRDRVDTLMADVVRRGLAAPMPSAADAGTEFKETVHV